MSCQRVSRSDKKSRAFAGADPQEQLRNLSARVGKRSHTVSENRGEEAAKLALLGPGKVPVPETWCSPCRRVLRLGLPTPSFASRRYRNLSWILLEVHNEESARSGQCEKGRDAGRTWQQ